MATSSDSRAAVSDPSAATAYEARLDSDPRWALLEGSRHFEENSAVFATLRKIARRLDGLNVPYAIIDGMALFRHGYRRYTEDVDILVTKESLQRIHNELSGLGYLPPHRRSKHLRDTEPTRTWNPTSGTRTTHHDENARAND